MMNSAGAGALDYAPCYYGKSQAAFRGPMPDLSQPYVAMLGGTTTFGKFVATPYPALVEAATGLTVANPGGLNAGPDFYLSDRFALEVAARARVAVLQIPGAEVQSNRFYTVHNRRNDRFVAATPALCALFPEVDFTEIHFTRHLLLVLQRTDPARFRTVVAALQTNWVARMRQLLVHLPPRRVLLWLAETAPPMIADTVTSTGAALLVDAGMLATLGRSVTQLVEVVPSAAALAEGVDRMQFPEMDALIASGLPGTAVHAEVAARLGPVVSALI
ncbi:hypothetical protein MCELHM10_00484 [Paracoccaceae bacterium]